VWTGTMSSTNMAIVDVVCSVKIVGLKVKEVSWRNGFP
jgi:hypothetical protein